MDNADITPHSIQSHKHQHLFSRLILNSYDSKRFQIRVHSGGYGNVVSLKRVLPFSFALTCWIWALFPAGAAGLNVSSETIIGVLQRDTEKGEARAVIPVYEYVGLDYDGFETGGVSLHFYGWGGSDLADSAYFENNPDGELIYGYVDYHKPSDSLRGRFGRQHIFAGVINESVDGLLLENGWQDYFSITLFGGLPAAYADTNGRRGDITYGGRMAYLFLPLLELGLSYQKIEDNGAVARNNGGIDVNIQAGGWFSFNGLSSYRLDSDMWREHRYSFNISVEDFQIAPSYEHFQYSDYFKNADTGITPFRFLDDNNEILSIYGTDLIYNANPELQVGLRGRQYDYDLRNENARYWAGLLVFSTFDGSRIGAEVGSMDGQTPDNLYNLYRAYLYWQNPLQIQMLEFISADALFVTYDTPIYDKENSAQFSLGAGRNFFNNQLETRFSVIYSDDPYFENDLSGMATMQINY